MRTSLLSACLGLASLAALSGWPAAAQEPPANCKEGLARLQKDYGDTGLLMPSKPLAANVSGKAGHHHSGADMMVMQRHFREAGLACDQGKDHESMLHQDVVRAILNLPPVEHPAGHHYAKPPKG